MRKQSIMIYGLSVSGEATINGSLTVDGNLNVNGTLSKKAGSFEIEHPLDSNKVLRHSFVESPDMKNLYNGIAELDWKGQAEVQLPDYARKSLRIFMILRL